ncbi:MAG: LysR family transcriptional regulator [Candidatus Sericytochromatia bacterium]
MKNFSPAWLFQFQQLIEVGSFTETALKLNLSQQALSKNMQALEIWAGQALLSRLPGRLELTPAGAVLNETIPDLLQSLQQLNHRVHTPVSTLHVGASPHWNRHYLPTSLARVLKAWPELDLQVSPLWEKDITAFLLAGELDLGLMLNPPGLGLQSEALPEIRWVLAAAPGLMRQPLPYLLHVFPLAPAKFQDVSLLPEGAQCVGRIGSWNLLHELLLAGIGAAFAPWPFISEDLHHGRLTVLETPPLPHLIPYAVWLDGFELHPAARMLLDCLRGEMRETGP